MIDRKFVIDAETSTKDTFLFADNFDNFYLLVHVTVFLIFWKLLM